MRKVGIIGVGKMGLSHLAITKSTPGLEVVSVSDRSKALLRGIKKNLKINTYLNYKEMIDNESIDSAVVSVPNGLHYEIVNELLTRKINVFIEKPLTLCYSQSQKLLDLSLQNDCYLQVGYVNRFNPIFFRLNEFIQNNLFGRILNYKSEMQGCVVTSQGSGGWRNSYEKGGGCLYDYGPHCIDLACFLFGSDMNLENSFLKSIHSTEVDDEVIAHTIHDSGISGQLYINWCNSKLRKASNTIHAEGEYGSFHANKQEINFELKHDCEQFGYSKGQHSVYITDLKLNVEYYLRGEDFSRQMFYFSNEVNRIEQTRTACVEGAVVTDRMITDILFQNGICV
jgi:predicted dehydrogenase